MLEAGYSSETFAFIGLYKIISKKVEFLNHLKSHRIKGLTEVATCSDQ
jgi:hypothetical protein